MENILHSGFPFNGQSAPGGAKANLWAGFTGMGPKWPAVIANRIATLRTENVQPKAQVQTTRRAKLPHPGCLGADCHPVQRLSVDDHATNPQIAYFKPTSFRSNCIG